jgi:hypothetical protein
VACLWKMRKPRRWNYKPKSGGVVGRFDLFESTLICSRDRASGFIEKIGVDLRDRGVFLLAETPIGDPIVVGKICHTCSEQMKSMNKINGLQFTRARMRREVTGNIAGMGRGESKQPWHRTITVQLVYVCREPESTAKPIRSLRRVAGNTKAQCNSAV